LLSSQRDSNDSFWQDIVYNVYDVVVNKVLDLIAEDSSEDEEKTSVLTDVPKKRARHQFGPESSKRSYF
jgi:hypothetical protein